MPCSNFVSPVLTFSKGLGEWISVHVDCLIEML